MKSLGLYSSPSAQILGRNIRHFRPHQQRGLRIPAVDPIRSLRKPQNTQNTRESSSILSILRKLSSPMLRQGEAAGVVSGEHSRPPEPPLQQIEAVKQGDSVIPEASEDISSQTCVPLAPVVVDAPSAQPASDAPLQTPDTNDPHDPRNPPKTIMTKASRPHGGRAQLAFRDPSYLLAV